MVHHRPAALAGQLRGRKGVFIGTGLDSTLVHGAFARAPASGFSAVLSMPAKAVAAERERHEAEDRARQLARIQGVTDIALRNAEPDELLRQLVDAVRLALDTDTATGLRVAVSETVVVPLDRGVAGAMAAREAGLVIDDLGRVDVVSRFLRERVKSLVGAPIRVEDRLLGVLHVGTTAPRHFTDEDLALLRLVAERVGLALERTRLLAAERAARAEAEALAGVASEIGATLDLQRVLERVGRAARELCESDVIRIALREPDTPVMTYRYLDSTGSGGYDGIRLEPGRGFVGEVLRTGKPYCAPPTRPTTPPCTPNTAAASSRRKACARPWSSPSPATSSSTG